MSMTDILLTVSVGCNLWFLFLLLYDRIMGTKMFRFFKGIAGLWRSLESKGTKSEAAHKEAPAEEAAKATKQKVNPAQGPNEKKAIAYLDGFVSIPNITEQELVLINKSKQAITTGKFQQLQRDINKLKTATKGLLTTKNFTHIHQLKGIDNKAGTADVAIKRLIATNASIIRMLTRIAVSLLRTVESIATPYSR